MRYGLLRLCALGFLAISLAGCAADDGADYTAGALPQESGRNVAQNGPQKPLECVPYAREHSGVRIYGDAWTWWDKAAGHFARAATPQDGAVLVLTDYAGPEHGHLAVVRRIVSAREIRIDHANWLDDGAIYINDPVADVSAGNDWSAVRVWNIKTGGWGAKTYPVKGFILPADDNIAVAQADPGQYPE